MTAFKESAESNKGKMLFTYSGVNSGIQARLADFMGVSKTAQPTLWALVPDNMLKYKFETNLADVTSASINKFVEDVLSKGIRPTLKSAEPKANDGPMTHVVGKNFEELVLDSSKDVLV